MPEIDTRLDSLVKICKALSDPTRLRIFLFLTKRSLCVNAIVNFLNISQPAVSQHLRVLREAGLVRVDKRGYWMHYSANFDKLKDFLDILSKIVQENRTSEKMCRRVKNG